MRFNIGDRVQIPRTYSHPNTVVGYVTRITPVGVSIQWKHRVSVSHYDYDSGAELRFLAELIILPTEVNPFDLEEIA